MPQAEKSNFENLSETELKSAKKVNEKIKALQLNEYPEDFLNDLKEQDPEAFQEFTEMNTENETPAGTIYKLDSALTEWTAQERYNTFEEEASTTPEKPVDSIEKRIKNMRKIVEESKDQTLKMHLKKILEVYEQDKNSMGHEKAEERLQDEFSKLYSMVSEVKQRKESDEKAELETPEEKILVPEKPIKK